MKGYVVQNECGAILTHDDCFGSPLLLRGDVGTVFTERRKARLAVSRTTKYAAANKLKWNTSRWTIARVEVPATDERGE